MEDVQMKKLIEGIRENENKTQVLSQHLIHLNEAFNSLIEHLSETEPFAALKEKGEKVLGVNERLEHVAEEIKESRILQEEKFNELTYQIERRNEAGRDSRSETALYHQGKIYIVSQDRLCVSKYNTLSTDYEIVYGEEREISELFVYQDKVFVHHKDGRLCSLEGETLHLHDIKKVISSTWGLMLLDKGKHLRLYKNSKYEIILAEGVEHFELLSGRYLFYQTAATTSRDIVIYKEHLKDLMTSPVEEKSAKEIFAYGVDEVHDKVYTIDAAGNMKEQTE